MEWNGDALSLPVLAGPDQYARRKDQRAAEYHLKRGAEERRFHVFVLNPRDRPKFDEHDGDGDDRRGPEIRDQVGQGMAQPTHGGHDTRGNTALDRAATSRQFAVVA